MQEERERGTQAKPTENPSRSKVVNFLGLLIVVLLLLTVVFGYLFFRKARESNRIQIELTAEKDSISRNLEQVLTEYQHLQTDNVGLQARLTEEQERAEKLLQEIKQVKEVSYGKIKEYQRELGTLRAIMRKMVGEIDSLNTLNQNLMAENTRMRGQYTESQRNVQELTSQNEELSTAVQRGSVVKARNVEIMALNKKGSVVKNARRTSKLRTCFTLMENAITKPGLRDVFIRLTAPDGVLLTDPQGGTFTHNGKRLPYSAKREIDYQNKDVEMCIFYDYNDDASKFSKGVYQVEVYMDEELVGQGEFLLR